MQLELPKYINPSDRDYSAYFDHIKQFNAILQSRISDYLSKAFLINPHSDKCILVTGSDGRLEKGPQSKVELIVLKEFMDPIDGFVDQVRSITETNSGANIFELVEVKDLEKDTMSCYNNEPDRVFPGRIIEARSLAGNDYLCQKSKKKLYQEMVGENGKRIKERTKGKEREYKNIMRTGIQMRKGEQLKHFDMEAGAAYHDPEAGVLSFKYGPLRYVQFVFLSDIIAYSRQNQTSELLCAVPTNVVERLYDMESRGLSKLGGDIVDLVDNYKHFLWLYHLSQSKFNNDGQKEMQFDRQEVAERIRSTERILEKRIIKTD